jgi:hypothetical protein
MKAEISGTSLLKLLSVTLMMVLFTPFIAEAQTAKVNFSGTWVLNEGKSTLSDNPRMGGGNFIAVQEANLLSVERTRTNRDGENITTKMKYTLDGKESINTSPRGDSKSVASWSADGKTLNISTARTFEMNGETINMKTVEVWTLNSPVTVTIQSTTTTPNGERKMTMVDDKK